MDILAGFGGYLSKIPADLGSSPSESVISALNWRQTLFVKGFLKRKLRRNDQIRNKRLFNELCGWVQAKNMASVPQRLCGWVNASRFTTEARRHREYTIRVHPYQIARSQGIYPRMRIDSWGRITGLTNYRKIGTLPREEERTVICRLEKALFEDLHS